MSRLFLLTLSCSIALHLLVSSHLSAKRTEQTASLGGLVAPVSMTFSSVTPNSQASSEKSETEPPVERLREPEPDRQEKSVPVAKKEAKPSQQQQPAAEAVAAQKSALEESVVEGLSDKPVLVSEPAIRQSVTPVYPRIAQRRNQQGVVMLEVIVDTDGRALEVSILESSGFDLLDRSAIKAVTQWIFEPQKQGNQLVSSRVHVPVAFELNSG